MFVCIDMTPHDLSWPPHHSLFHRFKVTIAEKRKKAEKYLGNLFFLVLQRITKQEAQVWRSNKF